MQVEYDNQQPLITLASLGADRPQFRAAPQRDNFAVKVQASFKPNSELLRQRLQKRVLRKRGRSLGQGGERSQGQGGKRSQGQDQNRSHRSLASQESVVSPAWAARPAPAWPAAAEWPRFESNRIAARPSLSFV